MIPNFKAGQRLSHADLNAMATEINNLLGTAHPVNPALPGSREQPLRTPIDVGGGARIALANDAPPGYTNDNWGRLLARGRRAHEFGNIDPREHANGEVKFLDAAGTVFQTVGVDEDGHIKTISCMYVGEPTHLLGNKWGRWWDGYSTCGTGCSGGFFTMILGCVVENCCTMLGCGEASPDTGNHLYYLRSNEMQVPPLTVNSKAVCGEPLVKPMGDANVVRIRKIAPGAGVSIETCEDFLRISAGGGSRPINPPGACTYSVPMVGCTTPDGTHIRMLKGYGGTRVRAHCSTSPDICQADIISREVCSVEYECLTAPALDLIACADCCHVYLRKVRPLGGTAGCEDGQLLKLWTAFPVSNVTASHGAAAAPGADGWELTLYLPSVKTGEHYNDCMGYVAYRQLMRFRGSPTEGCLQVVQQERPVGACLDCSWVPSNIPPDSCS